MVKKNAAAGRAPANVEFVRTLQRLTGLNQRRFAAACGQKQPNMNAYLNNRSVPGDKALRSCLRHLLEWPVAPLMEIEPIPSRIGELPTSSGVYVIYDSAANVLYIGQAASFRAEVRQTLERQIPVPIRLGPTLGKTRPKIGDLAHAISLYAIESARARHNLEALLLRVAANQTHNSNIGKFK